ncbi:hypothetical protein A8135_09330 [Legionella jamestowniensis]|uniref:Glycosyltransferase n=1 Tax=Legionella jamestowniensis TaxID=455 RepID=A0ABX2XX09_9GAMM|nr:glycosyltransferase [Legionella jamestowniensis]OCH98952.1 hypothetical protein A8135_09330 [Legionella jamestowniensis]
MKHLYQFLKTFARLPGKFETNEDNNQAQELYYFLELGTTFLNSITSTVSFGSSQIQEFDKYFEEYATHLLGLSPTVKGPRTYQLLTKGLENLALDLIELQQLIAKKQTQELSKQPPNPKELENLDKQQKRVELLERNLAEFRGNVKEEVRLFEEKFPDATYPNKPLTKAQPVDLKFGTRTDSIGLDPFNLRSFAEQDIGERLKLQALLEEHTKAAGSDNIPHIFHTIWLGSEWPAMGMREIPLLSNEKGPYILKQLEANVSSVKETNPDACHLLWTDREDIPEAMQNWCSSRNIDIVQIHKIFPLKGDKLEQELYAIYLNEKSKQSYAAAADVLRLMILRTFEGIYLDVDIKVREQLGEIAAKHGIRLNMGRVAYAGKGVNQKGLCNNDIMMANANGKELLESFCQELINNYHKTYAEIFKDNVPVDNTVIRYAKSFKDIIYYFLFKMTPVLTTGPGIVLGYFNKTKDSIPFEEHALDSKPFYMENIQTWIFTENDLYHKKNLEFYFENRESAIKHIITYVLHDLRREPRALRLDYYQTAIKKYDIGDEILKALITHAPEALKQVEHIQAFGEMCPNSTDNVLAAIDQGIFEKLDSKAFQPKLSPSSGKEEKSEEESETKIFNEKKEFLVTLKDEVMKSHWNTRGRDFRLLYRIVPDGIQSLRNILIKLPAKEEKNDNKLIETLFEQVEHVLKQKQQEYKGPGRRQKETREFYQEKYNECQTIVSKEGKSPILLLP